jgi:hypothetical protein
MLGENQMEERLRELGRDPRWSIAAKPGAETRIRAVALRQRLRTASATTAVIAALTAAIIVPLTVLPGGDASPSAHPPAQSATKHATITIDPQVGDTFAPAPASATPKLTAQQAWARYMRHIGNARVVIPSTVHVQLGLFTLPVGPATAPGTSHLTKVNGEAYTAYNELAYGYSSPSGCVTLNPRLMAPPGARCLYWDFLDANTGLQIDSTYQKIGHWHWLINPNGL